MWGLTTIAMVKFLFSGSAVPESTEKGDEGFYRLNSIFAKNKYGYNTRFMSDFELFLEAMLNEKFIDSSTLYYDDKVVATEIEDMEAGLNGDFSQSDVRHLNHDVDNSSHDSFKALRFPARVGTNYAASDDLSCYKILPKGQKPTV